MKKLNQKGFSAVEIILVIVVVALLGLIGWFVWRQRNVASDKAKSDESSTQDEQENVEAEDAKDTEEDETADWKSYSGHGVALKYPNGWVVIDKPGGQSEWVHISSKDYKGAQEIGDTVKGYELQIYVHKLTAVDHQNYEEALAGTKEAYGVCGGDYKEIKIDGYPAILDDMACHGPVPLSVNLYENSKNYMIRILSPDEDSNETKELFDNILSTVNIL